MMKSLSSYVANDSIAVGRILGGDLVVYAFLIKFTAPTSD